MAALGSVERFVRNTVTGLGYLWPPLDVALPPEVKFQVEFPPVTGSEDWWFKVHGSHGNTSVWSQAEEWSMGGPLEGETLHSDRQVA